MLRELTLSGHGAVETVVDASTDNVTGEGYTTSIVVDSLSDVDDGDHSAGELSLPEAIRIAGAITGHDTTIDFDPLLFIDGPQTLALMGYNEVGSDQLYIDDDQLTINGPGADLLLISGGSLLSGGGRTRVLYTKAGDITIRDVTLLGGYVEGQDGGGVYNEADLTLERVVVRNNSAGLVGSSGGRGGGVYSSNGAVTLIDATVKDNDAGKHGGGIFFVSSSDSLVIERSTIEGNGAANRAGGLGFWEFGAGAASSKFVNTTISGNDAHQGGGVTVWGAPDLDLINSTITKNSVPSDGGIGGFWNHGSSTNVTLHNTIVAGNLGGHDGGRDLYNAVDPASSHNLIGRGYYTGLSNGDANSNIVIDGADPGLLELEDHGGLVATHPLAYGSPAVDAGDPTRAIGVDGNPLTTDARGEGASRIIGSGIDIGASETHLFEESPGRFKIYGSEGEDSITLSDTLLTIGSGSVPGVARSGDFGIASSVEILAGDGDDYVAIDGAFANPVKAYGGNGDDYLVGSATSSNSLFGESGDDVLFGGDLLDVVIGGEGDDALFGGAGSDILIAEAGNDTVAGGEGPDYIDGGDGDDSLSGGDGDDTIDGGKGSDSAQSKTHAC